jgi:hypothetical protein
VKIGSDFKIGRQRYECVGLHNHVNRAGHASTLLVLQSRCAECGAFFTFMTTAGRAKQREINRRPIFISSRIAQLAAAHPRLWNPLCWKQLV